ncbi:MAG: FG-GAP repeat protein [Verrucomicrobia bacterium]|nr:FG-GAP repeat protein [Verrucomicrobiota bacterium]
MKKPLTNVRRLIQAGLMALALSAFAQQPNTLLHSIASPPAGVQSDGLLGYSVAVDGGYTVVGAVSDDFAVADTGVVKIFDTMTGALLWVLPNPSPDLNDEFGNSVAIAGTRVVVGTPRDDTGASNAGRAYVFDLSSSTPTVPVTTLNNPSPTGFDLFGGSVAISGSLVVVGATGDDTGATDAGIAYVYDLTSGTPAEPMVLLTNPSPAASDSFGNAVAISGTRVLIGAYQDDASAADAGSVYVYDLATGTSAVPVTTLNNPEPGVDDRFGHSVAISGTQVVVGALLNDTGGENAGSAYVYDLSSATPAVPVITLNNPRPASGVAFGNSVASSGALVVVGAAYLDNGTGVSFVYDLSSGTPSLPVVTLANPTPAAFDWFGYSVAISNTRIVVGAYGDGTGAPEAGSAYVFDLSNGAPTVPTGTLNHPGPTLGDAFGMSVAISGTRIVVGAPLDDTGAVNSGAAYVYDRSHGMPTVPVSLMSNPSPSLGDSFGNAVAISGAFVVVGAYDDDTDRNGAGIAYVYDLSSGTPTVPVITLHNPSPGAFDSFGRSVAIDGTRVVVGASKDDSGGSSSGSVYVYDLNSSTPAVPVAALPNPTPASNDDFGRSVAISGSRLVVGALNDDTSEFNSGSAYVYDLNSSTPTVPVATLNNPAPSSNDLFGCSVAISGTRVLVGALGDNTIAEDGGAAYVYDLTSGTPLVPATTLSSPSPAAYQYFGYTVAISGTRILVGANDVDYAGSVYVYDLNNAPPALPVTTLHKPSPVAGDQFAWSLALDGVTAVIGAPGDDTTTTDKGAAYIFGPHPLDQDSDTLLDFWELTHWPSTTGHRPLDDDDHDGLVNLLEMAFGLNPTLPSAGGLPAVANEGGFMTMTITKQPGAAYEVQSAGTLLPALPDSFSASSTTVLLNDATTLKVRDNTLFGTPPARFMRVQVTGAP